MDPENDTPDTPAPTTTPETPAPPAGDTFSREYVEKLRSEAADHRTKAKTAAEEARAAADVEWQAKIQEHINKTTSLETELSAAGTELTKLKIALGLEVPSSKVLAFAATLQGSSEEELKASAESNYTLFSGGALKKFDLPTDVTQGRGGDNKNIPLNGDPIMAALAKAVGIPGS